jgi:hypothetical protein
LFGDWNVVKCEAGLIGEAHPPLVPHHEHEVLRFVLSG